MTMRSSVRGRSPKPPALGVVSLGCAKALVDSEVLMTQLRLKGYRIVSDYAEADLVLINTCGFIDPAIDESLQAIREALESNGRVIVTGCLGKRGSWLKEQYPELLAVTGPAEVEKTVELVARHLPMPRWLNRADPSKDSDRIALTPKHYRYLKIAEGCHHRCSFCIIPQLRGDLRSVPSHEVLQQAEQLVASGAKELLVIAQDTSHYGQDLHYAAYPWRGQEVKSRLPELCRVLGDLAPWVRLHYLYPYPLIDELIPLMVAKRILPYLDVPWQHISPDILRAMGRPGGHWDLLAWIHRWRDACPDLVIRSTFIVGFPGESEADFAMLLDFLEKAQLDRVGCFVYSPVEGAKANQLTPMIPESVAIERYEQLMALQSEISAKKLATWVGRREQVLIDEVMGDQSIGRMPGDAPEVDGRVFIPVTQKIVVGEFYPVEITHSEHYDLHAKFLS